VPSNFEVIWLIVAADIELADPAGKSSIVIATWRSGCVAALELTAAAMTENAQTTTKTAHGGFMKVPPQASDKSAEGVLEHERDSFSRKVCA
jgi:hypothetical protein